MSLHFTGGGWHRILILFVPQIAFTRIHASHQSCELVLAGLRFGCAAWLTLLGLQKSSRLATVSRLSSKRKRKRCRSAGPVQFDLAGMVNFVGLKAVS